MSLSKLTLRAIFALLCAALFAVGAHAQFKASIQGTVLDPQGNAVAGAKVTVTNKETGISRDTVAGDTGFYRVPELAPGTYTVIVEAPGFKKSVSNDVVIQAEQPRGFDVTLAVGAVQESVTVTAAAAGLQTEDANVGNTIDEKLIQTLPQYGRDPYELVRLTPGIFGDGARQGNGNALAIPQQVGPGGSNAEIFQTENQVQIVADGQRTSANNFTLDGVSTNSLNWGGASVITPNQESVQEVVTTSSSFSAEDGRNSGAQVKVISKYGTNNFHGSAIIKFNDKGLNAFNKFFGPTNVPLSAINCEGGAFSVVASHCPSRNDQKYREFGGSLGGPVYKDKIFFFFSYEGVRLNSSSLIRDVKLETAEFRQYVQQVNPGSLAAKLFSTPGIAPRIESTVSTKDCCSLITNPSDPNFHPLGMWYQPGAFNPNDPTTRGLAAGNGPDGISDWGVFDLRVPNSSSGNQFNGRVDYTAGKNQFFFSTYFTRLDNLAGGQRPIEDLTLKPLNSVGTIGWTRTIGSSMVNEARGNFTRWNFNQLQPEGQTNYGIPQIRLFDFDAGGLGDAGRMMGIARSFTTPGKLAQNTFAFRDVLSWMHRSHAFKFGIEIAREQNNDNESGGARPDYQFRGLLNLANDACCFFEEASVNPNTGAVPDGQRYFRTGGYGLFAQDDWKIRPNLTINLGLRWEYFPPVTETQNRLSNYIFGTQGFANGSVKVVNQLYNPDRNNFAPRLGLAWSPSRFQNKLVFRGGFGLLFERHFGTEFTNIRQNTPFFAEPSSCCFFDPGKIVGPPPGSNILYALGSDRTATSFPANPGFANGVAPDGALCGDPACSFVTKVDLFAALPNEPNPYVYAFSYQAQAEPIHNLQVTLGYQGSRSRKLVRTIDLNRFIPGDTFDPCNPVVVGQTCGNRDEVQSASSDGVPCGSSNPACPAPIVVGNNRFNRVFIPLPDVNASFDAMIFQVTRRFAHGFQFSSLYTWSHSIDTASYEIGYQQTDPSNQLLNKGSSDFDVRHNWSLSGLWALPFLSGRKDFLGTTLGGWTISGILSKHSGFPFAALIGSCDPNNDKNGDGYCPDMPSSYSGGAISNPSKQQWINGIFPNPSAEFDTSTRGPGCRCRNIFTGPGYTSLDFMIGKDFRLPRMRFIGESSKLEFRANFFNLFNILNLTPLIPATAPTDIKNTGSFGRPSDGLSGRVAEFQARFSF